MYKLLLTIAAAAAALASSVMAKRVITGDCELLATGFGPRPTEVDTPAAFFALKSITDSATSAVVPPGYIQSYSNTRSTYNEPSVFAGYVELTEYDVDRCKYTPSLL
jgi:hypothetical protein